MIFLTSFLGILILPWIILIPLFLLEWILRSHIFITPYVIEVLIIYDLIIGVALICKYIIDKIGGENDDTE